MSPRFNCLLMTFWSGETKCQLLSKFRAKLHRNMRSHWIICLQTAAPLTCFGPRDTYQGTTSVGPGAPPSRSGGRSNNPGPFTDALRPWNCNGLFKAPDLATNKPHPTNRRTINAPVLRSFLLRSPLLSRRTLSRDEYCKSQREKH
jgi:hypothetical protein